MSEINSLDQSRSKLSPAKLALLEKWGKGQVAAKETVIPRRSSQVPCPLSFAQQRLWFLDQLVPGSPAYNVTTVVRINGRLDIAALRDSLDEIVRRHETLRTTFTDIEGEPIQVIHPVSESTLIITDLSSLPAIERESQVAQQANHEAQQPFDLARGPLLRSQILHLGVDEHVLLINMHHIISDGWSINVFVHELTTLYQARVSGTPSPLSELPIQYADFAAWQRQWLQGAELERQTSYWKRQLAGAPTLLELPADRPRPVVQSFRGNFTSFELSPVLTKALNALSQQENATLFMSLVAAFQTLLYRYSGQTDILLGTPIGNRSHVETEGLIGFFANTLVLRTSLSGNPTFRQLLSLVRETTLGAYAHQDLPFEKLIDELHLGRNMSYNPLFQVMLVLQNTPTTDIVLPTLTLSPVAAHSQTAKFDLWFSFTEGTDKIGAVLEYSTDLFEAATIQRLVGHFENLLQNILTDPDQPIADVPFLTESERCQILQEWNATQTLYPQALCLHQWVEAQAKRTPNADAVIFEGHRLSYQALNQRANQLAHHLSKLGVGPDVLVGVYLERSLEMVVGLLGILKAGGAYVPLDPSYPPDRLAFMLEDSQVRVLLTQENLTIQLPQFPANLICLDTDWIVISQEDIKNPDCNLSPENLAYMIYTSGSTGQPKGAMNTHRGIVNRLQWMQSAYQLNESDRVLQKTPFSFDVSVWEFFWPLLTGACIVLARPEGHKDSAYLVELIKAESISTLHFVPSMLRAFLEETGLEQCASLRRVICSGEALPYQFQERFLARLKHVELHNLYGPTEAAVDVTFWACEPDNVRKIVPIGRPIANTQIYLLDAQLNPVPVGVPGELYIGGTGLGRGYLNRPDLTAEKFIPNPFAVPPAIEDDGPLTVEEHSLPSTVNGRLYRTGDLARYLSDGAIEFLGRLDFQVKLRGFRIELGEIETVLRQHSTLEDAAVVVKEIERLTAEQENSPIDKQLVAYIVPRRSSNEIAGDRLSTEQVTQWQTVFNDTYSTAPSQADASFNIVGWNSSYTGEPLPAEEMQVWVDQTVERILAFQPQQVLEIGCGTGLLLFRIAPHCQAYWGTDISGTILAELEKQVAAPETDMPQVTLRCQPAHNLEGIPAHSFDTVILNSVVQYFPSVDYLMNVLEKVVQILRPGGRIFIGDARSLPLLEAFHTSVEFAKAPTTLATRLLRLRAQKRMTQEQELVIDPVFFSALRAHIPAITQAEVQLKRGRAHNELTRFRYDVTLHVGDDAGETPQITWLDWKQDKLTLATLRQRLIEGKIDVLGVKGIPNARLATERQLLGLLKSQQPPANVVDLRQALLEDSHLTDLDPEALWALGDELSFQVQVSYSGTGEDICCAVIFQPGTNPGNVSAFEAALALAERTSTDVPWGSYANYPLREKLAQQLVPELRKHLKEKLPEYMLPNSFVLLDELPISPNGKLDRQALPPPPPMLPEMEANFVAPRTPMEETLARIWSQVLGLERIGVHNNFFELGGDSIQSIQIVTRAMQAGLRLTPKNMFQHQTIAELAPVVTLASEITTANTEIATFPGSLLSKQERQQLEHILDMENIEDAYPLSPFQQNMLYHRLHAPIPGLYIVHHSHLLRIAQKDAPIIEKAWQALVRRHSILRSSFLWKDLDRPLQIVHKLVDLSLEQQDWRGMASDEQAEHLAAYTQAFRERGFELSETPHTKVALFQIADDAYYYFWAFDYMLQDGWSYPIIFNDLLATCEAFAQGQTLQIEPAPSYRNHVAWLQQQTLTDAEAFWQNEFKGFSGPTPLAKRIPGNEPERLDGYEKQEIVLAPSTASRLNTVARQQQLTLNTLLQGAWALLLSRYSGQSDVTFGVIVSGRSPDVPGIETIAGLINNLLPARIQVPSDASLCVWLKDLQTRQVGLRDYEYNSLLQIKEWIKVPQSASLFESYLVFENFPINISVGEYVSKWQLEHLDGFVQTEQPLRFMIVPGESVLLSFGYYRRYFTAATISNMLQYMQTILEAMATNLDQSTADIMCLIDSVGE